MADLAAVLKIYGQPAVDNGDTLPEDAARALLQKFSAYPSYHLYVACLDSEVVGTLPGATS